MASVSFYLYGRDEALAAAATTCTPKTWAQQHRSFARS